MSEEKVKSNKKIRKLSNEELAVFCEQLAMMLDAAIMPIDGVWIMLKDAEAEDAKDLQPILSKLVDELHAGKRLYEAMEIVEVFPKYCVDMIRIGEDSGKLTDVMHSLSFHYNREQAISDSIKGSLKYPLFIVAIMFVVILVLVIKVLPIFNDVYIQLGSEMTGFSKKLLSFGNAVSKSSIVIIGILLLITASVFMLFRNDRIRNAMSSFLSDFFITRNLYEEIAIARFASGMALTWNAGLSIERSLEMVAEMIDNKHVNQKILKCLTSLRDRNNKKTFTELLVDAEIFNALYSRMIAISGKSGSVDKALERIATKYDEHVDKRISGVISILEPTLVIVFSMIICGILLSVMLPLMNIMRSIG
ncbi:MAG: type II secretion system F family protein [Lachnospiraceae bacterium]|nr:type II secretion system F family protein [Lachnospiraceae bacterium]